MIGSPSMLPGERVIWSGEPGKGIQFQAMDIFLIPLSFFWFGFAIFFTSSVVSMGARGHFDWFGVLFVALGLYFVFGRFIVDIWVRSATSYTVTNRRILIERGGLFAKQTVISLADLPPLSLRVGGSGRGTIRFGESMGFWGGRNGFASWTPSLDSTPQFIQIEDAQNAFDLINRTRDDLLRSAGVGEQ